MCCHAFTLASCGLLRFNGEDSNGRYGLFFLNLPDSGTETCTEMRFVDEVTGRYGDDGPIWEPRQDTVSSGSAFDNVFSILYCDDVSMAMFQTTLFSLIDCNVIDLTCSFSAASVPLSTSICELPRLVPRLPLDAGLCY